MTTWLLSVRDPSTGQWRPQHAEPSRPEALAVLAALIDDCPGIVARIDRVSVGPVVCRWLPVGVA